MLFTFLPPQDSTAPFFYSPNLRHYVILKNFFLLACKLQRKMSVLGEFTFGMEHALACWRQQNKMHYHIRFHIVHASISTMLSDSFPSPDQPTHSRMLIAVCVSCVAFVCVRIQRSKCDSWRSSLRCCLTLSSNASSSSTWMDWWMTPWRCTRTGRLWTCGASRRRTLSERSKQNTQT